MSGGKTEVRDKGGNAVVGIGGFGFGFWGYVDSGLGGRVDGGGRRYGHYRDCNGQLVKWVGYCSNHNLRDRA